MYAFVMATHTCSTQYSKPKIKANQVLNNLDLPLSYNKGRVSDLTFEDIWKNSNNHFYSAFEKNENAQLLYKYIFVYVVDIQPWWFVTVKLHVPIHMTWVLGDGKWGAIHPGVQVRPVKRCNSYWQNFHSLLACEKMEVFLLET